MTGIGHSDSECKQMRYFRGNTQLNGQFEIDGIKFPSNWLLLAAPEDLERWGITTLPDLPPPPMPVFVPPTVTMRQARLALLGAGVLSQVEGAINALPEPQRTAAKITWEYSTEVHRHNGLVSQMAPALGMTAAQIDALFTTAATL